MTKVIDSFRGKHKFLSNFYVPAPTMYDGVIYQVSSEHAYVAAKTLNPEERKFILSIPTPKEVRRYGHHLALRCDWEDVKIGIMHTIVQDKFTRNKELRKKLLGTGDAELIERNTWGDKFWGVCNGEGENHLGKILMSIRTEIKEAQEEQDANH